MIVGLDPAGGPTGLDLLVLEEDAAVGEAEARRAGHRG